MLGASNLTRWFPWLVDQAALATTAPPCDVLVAMGYGRSYGAASRLLVRNLPGILSTDLWRALDNGQRVPTTALLTDIGNDLMYGVPVEQLLGWIADCVDRLERHAPRVVVSLPAIDHLPRMSPARYYLARTILFPACRLSYDEALDRAASLHQGLLALASSRRVATVCQPADWYGLDPIHPPRSGAIRLWQALFRAVDWPYGPIVTEDIATMSVRPQRLPCRVRPARCWWFGAERTVVQPAVCFANGTTISCY